MTARAAFDRELWEERAAIMEFEGGLQRADAERLAALAQGYTIAEVREIVRRRGAMIFK